jgi:BolA family transcriptional regulator, general stress-responsive regulator
LADYDNAIDKASSLDIAKPSLSMRIDETMSRTYCPAMSIHQTVKHTITNKLREAFAPESLDVTDESHLHEGHAGHRPGGETHFRVYIVSTAFEGKSRIERHRMINAMLAAELAGSVHALAIKAQTPGEVR